MRLYLLLHLETPHSVIMSTLSAALTLMMVATCACETVVLHRTIGSTIELELNGDLHITELAWYDETGVICHWVKDSMHVTCADRYKGRVEMNTKTGTLTLSNITSSDVYTLEVNNRRLAEYDVMVVEAVPRPTVRMQEECTMNSHTCVLLCTGNVSDVRDVNYFWKVDDGCWMLGDPDLLIENDAETRELKGFSCRLENEASHQESDVMKNPFRQVSSTSLYLSLGIVLGATALLVPLVAGLCWCPRAPTKKVQTA